MSSYIELSFHFDRRGRLTASVASASGTTKPLVLSTREEELARELVSSLGGIVARRWLEEREAMSSAELAAASADLVAKLKRGAPSSSVEHDASNGGAGVD